MTAENLTPAKFACSTGMSCEAIHRLEDGRLLIVGDRALSSKWPAGLAVGAEEEVGIISEDLLSDLIAEKIKEYLVHATAESDEPRGGQPFTSHESRLTVARMLIKSMHDEAMDYGLLNNLGGQNNHNLRWARTFLGLKEVMTEAEARSYLYIAPEESEAGA